MNKKEIRQLNSIQSSNTCSNILNDLIGKNISYQRESNLSSSKNNNNIQQNKSVSSNHILNSIGDETKDKSTINIKIKKKEKKEKKSEEKNKKRQKSGEKEEKDKNNMDKNKKKSREKIIKILKHNEKLKIPTGKRRSIAGNSLKLNINNMLKSLTPPKEIKIRTDKNGIEINKLNKKKVHITFRDDISPNNKITDTINIESYKKYNVFETLSTENNLSNLNKCCNIF
jgi:hypothetical protein